MFVPFYCPGMCHVSKEERKKKKYPLKSIECRFLGIIAAAYKIWIPKWRLIVSRRDVRFELSRDESLTLEDEKEQLLRAYRDLKIADDEYQKISEIQQEHILIIKRNFNLLLISFLVST